MTVMRDFLQSTARVTPTVHVQLPAGYI